MWIEVPGGHGGAQPDSVTGPADTLPPPPTVHFAFALTMSPFAPLMGMVLDPEELVRSKVFVVVVPFTVTDSSMAPPVEGKFVKENVTPVHLIEIWPTCALAGPASSTTSTPAVVTNASRALT